MDLTAIEQVLERHRDALMAVPGVVGTAIGVSRGQPCIRVYVSTANESPGPTLPQTLDGVPVVVTATSAFRALPDS